MTQDKLHNTVLIVGCGYIGQRVAAVLQVQNIAVTGCVRSKQSAAQIDSRGIHSLIVDLDQPAAKPCCCMSCCATAKPTASSDAMPADPEPPGFSKPWAIGYLT